MQVAYNQTDQYVHALPTKEGLPPVIIVTDVGPPLALYSEFSRPVGTEVPFTAPRDYQIKLDELRQPEATPPLIISARLPSLNVNMISAQKAMLSGRVAALRDKIKEQG